MTTIYIVIAIAVVVIFWLIASYNRLVTLRNRAKEAASDIEVQQKRRYDLIPNLVETVKGYMMHEQTVFQKVTEARARAMGATSAADKAGAENMLTGALKSLFAVAENYPELKANENFGKLQDELTDTEDKIQASRRFYNGNVRDLNTSIERFPTNVIAGMFSFKPMEFFDIDEKGPEGQPVKVGFS